MARPLFAEADTPLLKSFLISRLQTASEADPDVLSDYILALLRHDQSPEEVMQTCITQLADFITSDPSAFVTDLFAALTSKSYLRPSGGSRKRSFETASQSPPAPYPNKYPRPSYHPLPTTSVPQQQLPYNGMSMQIPHQQPPLHQWPGIPPSRYAPWPGQGPPPPGWNANPVPLPIQVPIAQPWPVTAVPPRPKVPRIKGTCFDYIEKGVCLRGAACPYDHGLAPAVISPTGELEGTDPYDPLRPNTRTPVSIAPPIRPPIPVQTPVLSHRFEILKGPNHTDKSNTTLVVEGVPPENFNESAIRGWFSQFGPLNQVIIDHTWGKAILVYADYDSAAKAWNDPRPVFSNRFVKIWWKKMPQTTSISTPPPNNAGGNGTLSGAIVDQVELEIAKEAAMKAQKEHEEKQKRKEELEKKKEELERQRVKLLERQKQEREKLMEKIRRAEEKKKNKDVTNGSSASASPQQPQKDQSVTPVPEDVSKKETTNGTEQPADESSERKAHLQKMLTDLQNQAKALNIPPSEYTLSPLSDTTTRTKTTFRGSYRSRPYVARGRGRGGPSRSLDLRPKSILVPSIVGTPAETSVREWVISNYADAIVETPADDTTALLVKFKERYEAEEFWGKMSVGALGDGLSGSWYNPSVTGKLGDATSNAITMDTTSTSGEGGGLEKEYVYDEEEEGEVGESEGRWKR